MKLMHHLLTIAGLGLGVAWPSASPLPPDRPRVEQVLAGLQQKYDQIESFSADFTQIFRSYNFEEQESGILIIKKPGKMYWEYRSPTSKLFVSDGKKSYFYVPADQQVFEAELRLNVSETPLLFLLGEGDIETDFSVGYEEDELAMKPDNLLIRLTPKRPSGEFSHVLLEVDHSTFLIFRLAVLEPIGNRNDYILTNFQENVPVPDEQFKFRIPPGTEVVRQR